MEIQSAIRSFSAFLNSSWEVVLPLLRNREYTSNEGSIGDWLQSNWELLVETNVLGPNQYLEVYSAGADLHEESSRITFVNVLPTHVVVANPVSQAFDVLNQEQYSKADQIYFDRLIGFKNGYYVDEPPFNWVLLCSDSGDERVFRLEDVNFELRKI